MKIPKSHWNKRAIITMIVQEKSTEQLAAETGFTRQYVAAILYERVVSPTAVKKISSALHISDSNEPMTLTVKV